MPKVGTNQNEIMNQIRRATGFDVGVEVQENRDGMQQKLYDPGRGEHVPVDAIILLGVKGTANAQRHISDTALHAGASENFVVGSVAGQLAVAVRDGGGKTSLEAAKAFGDQVARDAAAARKDVSAFIEDKIGVDIKQHELAEASKRKPPGVSQ